MNISVDEIPMPVAAPASFSLPTGSNAPNCDGFSTHDVSDSVAWRKAQEALIQVAKESSSVSSARLPEVAVPNFQQVFAPTVRPYYYPCYYPASEPAPSSNLVDVKGRDSTLDESWSNKKMPDGAKKYVIRAMECARTAEDEEKIEKLLRLKLLPLLESGIAWRMNWINEPLPTDPAFKLPSSNAWIPAADLKKLPRPSLRTQKLGCGRNIFGMGQRSRSPSPDIKDSRGDYPKEHRQRKLK
ncbi:hypothetical protein TTRE_0000958801 [Trichuris trichiura]|uniref:Uncharacterized protein n=1 Tax=Trichuris trichiura TaxID=36087 RepID=A0A077ZN66_TRITR|nr:hypothetical protein TTRE_0000958801 [Trichuris trichiura]